MKFWIITPTFNRYNILKRNIESVKNQEYHNYEHIIIDDSTDNKTSENIFKEFNINDWKIKYIKNNKNSGVNYSRNVGLNNLSSDVDYIIFLDDDDYFNKETFKKAIEVITTTNQKWLFSNKKNITNIKKYNTSYNYYSDYFWWNIIKWDATHVIKKSLVGNIRFSKYIKQWEEWLFFMELWNKVDFYTYNYDSTISEYLEWWLSDNAKKSKSIVNINQLFAVIEFLLIRKVNFKTKIDFILKAIKYIIKKKK